MTGWLRIIDQAAAEGGGGNGDHQNQYQQNQYQQNQQGPEEHDLAETNATFRELLEAPEDTPVATPPTPVNNLGNRDRNITSFSLPLPENKLYNGGQRFAALQNKGVQIAVR